MQVSKWYHVVKLVYSTYKQVIANMHMRRIFTDFMYRSQNVSPRDSKFIKKVLICHEHTNKMQTKFQRSRKFQQSGKRTPPIKMSMFQSKLLLLIETERRRSIKCSWVLSSTYYSILVSVDILDNNFFENA